MSAILFRIFGIRKNADPGDPVYRSYKRCFRFVRNIVLTGLALLLVFIFFGVPSVHTTYKAVPTDGTPTAMDKTEADYWNPLSGWRTCRAGELAPGCPLVAFMPLRDCVNLEPYRNPVTLFLFGKEFFDGP